MSAGKQQIKQLTLEISGPMIKETDEMVLVDNGDHTATWYDKALIQNEHRAVSGKITFICTRAAAVRNVRLK